MNAIAPSFAFLPAPPHLAFLGMGGPWEMIIILLVVLILFGNRLPSMARNLGRSFTEFKKGVKGEKNQEALSQADEPQKVRGAEGRSREGR